MALDEFRPKPGRAGASRTRALWVSIGTIESWESRFAASIRSAPGQGPADGSAKPAGFGSHREVRVPAGDDPGQRRMDGIHQADPVEQVSEFVQRHVVEQTGSQHHRVPTLTRRLSRDHAPRQRKMQCAGRPAAMRRHGAGRSADLAAPG